MSSDKDLDKTDSESKNDPDITNLSHVTVSSPLVPPKPRSQSKKKIIQIDEGDIEHTSPSLWNNFPDHHFTQIVPSVQLRFPDGLMKLYTFGESMGRGGFGSVVKCWEKESGQAFACKVIKPKDMSRDKVGRKITILRELQGHPNIVTYKEAKEHKRVCYIFMSLCGGGTLATVMKKKGRFSELEATRAIGDLLEGIRYCHNKGVIHLDLQPENIVFLDDKETSRLQIIDFGLAIKFNPDVPISEYSAPEVLGFSYGNEMNIWSAGVILYQMLSGSLPFADPYVHTRDVHAVFTTGPWASVSEGAVDFVKKMLDRNTGTRLTAEQALAHPWLKSSSGSMSAGVGEQGSAKMGRVGEQEDESGSMSRRAGAREQEV